MSKLSRQKAIRELLDEGPSASQEELQKLLHRRGLDAGQATLSRDIRELGLVKSAGGYSLPGREVAAETDLPSVGRLVREFVTSVRAAQNLLVTKTSIGSAQPVAAAPDTERLPHPSRFSKGGNHENIELNLVDIFPALSGNGRYPLEPLSWSSLKQQAIELLFLATPHDVSRALVPEAVTHGMRVIDLSGAWRLKQAQHRAIYGFKDEESVTAAELTERAVYGLPELNADKIPTASIVANPGCYATTVILGLAPLLKAGLADREKGIIADSKSGVSGAGKDPTSRTHFVSVADNLSAYSVFNHRHLGEIAEQLHLSTNEITFTPHLLPIPRGILSTIYVHLKEATQAAEIERVYREFYKGKH